MKGILLFLVVFVVAATSASSSLDGFCTKSTNDACTKNDELHCDALYGGFKDHIEVELQGFTNVNLKHSYEYLLLASYFNNYQKSRPGFRKVFKELSDKLWEDSINLIKHITKRGGEMNFKALVKGQGNNNIESTVIELDEIAAMAFALDTEKSLAELSSHIHELASREHTKHDPEIASYMEEHFMEKQAEDIRKLSGYTNDLKNLYTDSPSSQGDNTLATYLFDEYLTKL